MLTDADVDRLEAAANATPRERAVFQFLREVGLRREAIANLRLDTVWDFARRTLLERFAVLEKGGKYRTVRPHPGGRLEAALREWLAVRGGTTAMTMTPGMYLFPHRRSPYVRVANLVPRLMARWCTRAFGHPRAFHAHLFRHWHVNRMVARGTRLEAVARWLGHASPNVTFRSYWTDAVMIDDDNPTLSIDRRNGDDDVDDGASTVELCDQLVACKDRLAEYRQRLRAAGLDVTPEGSDVDVDDDNVA